MCHSRDQGEQQLNDILSAGISTFVCLQVHDSQLRLHHCPSNIAGVLSSSFTSHFVGARTLACVPGNPGFQAKTFLTCHTWVPPPPEPYQHTPLQDELPPQDQLKLSGRKGFLPYKSTAQLIQAALNG